MEVDELEEDVIKRHAMENETYDEEIADENEEDEDEKGKGEKNKELREQMVQIDVNLRLNQIGLEILRADELVLAANIRTLGLEFQMRSFDMVVKSHLGKSFYFFAKKLAISQR